MTRNTKALIPLLAALALACIAVVAATGGKPDGRSKILLIGKDPDHPHGTHMYMLTCEKLAMCLELTTGVDAVVSNGWPTDEKTLEGVKTIVIYTDPAAERILDGPGAKKFEAMMKDGVGLVTIHWASSVYEKNLERLGGRWKGYLGGTWVSNVGIHTNRSQLEQLIPEHPVCRGWKPHELHDEYYLKPSIGSGKPLLQVKAPEDEVVVGWVHERAGGGRAFGTTLGHFYRNFQQADFRRMIVNGILWSAHVKVPEAGAPVTLSEEDLALPPQQG
ncbi:MAG: type 1 glutamine amidotransferase [Verrucomicrobiales bacterium]|jgi:type 1 glutamine amidotransferase